MQKYANLVDLEKCCQTHILLQIFVLIQPRTSPVKFAASFGALIWNRFRPRFDDINEPPFPAADGPDDVFPETEKSAVSSKMPA